MSSKNKKKSNYSKNSNNVKNSKPNNNEKNTINNDLDIKINDNDLVKDKSKETVNKKVNNSKVNHKENIDESNNSKIEKEIKLNSNTSINKNRKKEVIIYKHGFVHGILVLTLMIGLFYFIINLFYNSSNSFVVLISSLLIILFTLLFVVSSIKINRKNKNSIGLSSFLLILYFVFGILVNLGAIKFPDTVIDDLTNKNLSYAIKWSNKNDIMLDQYYEYSDMIDEYFIINQSIKPGTKLRNIKNLSISISQGPNPYKELIIPSMLGWDDEKVLKFIKDNHLSNVSVQFVDSNSNPNTVIEQNQSGKLKRNDEIKLKFAYDNTITDGVIKMKDLTNMSKFETIFYLNKYRIKYEFKEEFSNEVLIDHVINQSIKNSDINIKDDTVTITLSKGPQITVPDLLSMDMADVSNWIVDNKLKLEVTDKFDDTIKLNNVISSNYKKDDVITQGTLIKIVISRGQLLMEEYDNLDKFKEWADKNNIRYEEKHQFSDDVPGGNVISYSHKKGDVIKNDDHIVVTISDGKASSVPNVIGMSKNQASNTLKNKGFKYNFVYSYSNSPEGNVIRQSISAGNKVSAGTTITLTISKGQKPAPPPKPQPPACVPKTYTVSRSLNNVFANTGNFNSVKNAIYSHFSVNYPGVKINVVGVRDTGMTPGSYVSGIRPGSTITSCNNSPYVINIAQ